MNLHPPRRHWVWPGLSFALAFLCAGSRDLAAQPPQPEPIVWQDQYGRALRQAQAEKRLLWIQFTGPWCPNCARMERDSFAHPAIIEHARRSFVPLKLRSDLHEQLALAFGLNSLPASIIVAPNRDILAIRQGYLGPEELDIVLRDSLARCPVKAAAKNPFMISAMVIVGPALATPAVPTIARESDNADRKPPLVLGASAR